MLSINIDTFKMILDTRILELKVQMFTSESLILAPRTLGPSSGGVNKATDVTIKVRTATITRRAIKMPRQFL